MYRLNYSDLLRLSERLNEIRTHHIPGKLERWSPEALMTIINEMGDRIYVCDPRTIDFSPEALDDLVRVIARAWD